MRVRHAAGATVAAIAAVVISAAPLAAQRTVAELSPYAGYMIFGDYLEGPLGTSIGNANGTVLGAQLGFKLTPQIAIVGNVARASSDLEVGLPIIGGWGVGSSQVWLYDAGLQLSVPVQTSGGMGISPFVQGGIGGARHDISNFLVKTNANNLTYNIGAGADLMFSRALGVRIMAKDYIGRFDMADAVGFELGEGKMSHNFALSAGLKLAF